MSTFAVTAEQLTIHSHPNADALELAQVGEYRAVVRKGEFKTGDYAIYIPEQAIVPDDLLEELGLTGKLAGKQHNRVKAIRLRGELSQGIVCIPERVHRESAILRWTIDSHLSAAVRECRDFAELLEITKWVPEVPSSLSGEVIAAPDITRWIEIENIKRFPNIFEPDEPIIATEKIHGSCMCVTYVRNSDELFVSSKGFAGQSLAIVKADNNLYWRATNKYYLHEILNRLSATFPNVDRIALFGEVYGSGVQDLHYGTARKDDPGLAVFDIRIGDEWWPQERLRQLCDTEGLRYAPVIYEGPYDYDSLDKLAEGQSILGEGSNIREGLVVRSQPERRSDITGGRAIAKFVSESYLTRKGGTEFE